jgi:hypothetical protein
MFSVIAVQSNKRTSTVSVTPMINRMRAVCHARQLLSSAGKPASFPVVYSYVVKNFAWAAHLTGEKQIRLYYNAFVNMSFPTRTQLLKSSHERRPVEEISLQFYTQLKDLPEQDQLNKLEAELMRLEGKRKQKEVKEVEAVEEAEPEDISDQNDDTTLLSKARKLNNGIQFPTHGSVTSGQPKTPSSSLASQPLTPAPLISMSLSTPGPSKTLSSSLASQSSTAALLSSAPRNPLANFRQTLFQRPESNSFEPTFETQTSANGQMDLTYETRPSEPSLGRQAVTDNTPHKDFGSPPKSSPDYIDDANEFFDSFTFNGSRVFDSNDTSDSHVAEDRDQVTLGAPPLLKFSIGVEFQFEALKLGRKVQFYFLHSHPEIRFVGPFETRVR